MFGGAANPNSIASIVLGATMLQAANGLLQALLPLRMQATGLSATGIGAVAAAYGFGFAIGCLIAPTFVRRIGHIRAFASVAAVASTLALAFTQAEGLVVWSVLRALSGMALAGLFTVIESWISARAESENRGRALSIYMVATKLALMLAPLGLAFGAVEDDGLFMAISAGWTLCLLPVAATLSEPPPPPQFVNIEVASLFNSAPSAVVGSFAIGLCTGPVVALAPLYGVEIGMSSEEAAMLLLAVQGGSFALQWPLGWLSDRGDRRMVIAGIAVATALASGLIALLSGWASTTWITVAFALWGGLALSAYAICVAHASDLTDPDHMVSTISTLLVSWAAGATIGPLPGALAMDTFGADGLMTYAAAVAIALAAFIGLRMWMQTREAQPGGFVALSPTSPATSALTPRGPDLMEDAESAAAAGEPASAARAEGG